MIKQFLIDYFATMLVLVGIGCVTLIAALVIFKLEDRRK